MTISKTHQAKGAMEEREPTEDEVQKIGVLCSRRDLFCRYAPSIVTGLARSVGFAGTFDGFEAWSSRCSQVLMAPEFWRERESFVPLAKCAKRRTKVLLLCIYAFGVHGKLQEVANEPCEAEINAARRLRELASGSQQKMAPHIKTLEGAPGLWPQEARELDQALQHLTEIVNKPSGKLHRKQAHRGIDWLLLHLIAYMSGVQGQSPWWVNPVGWGVRSATALLFGAPGQTSKPAASSGVSAKSNENAPQAAENMTRKRLNISDCIRCAVIAERASGVATPRSFDALVEIYYEQHRQVWRPIRRHVDYHCGRERER